MKVKPKTPRTEMGFQSFVIKLSPLYETIAEELGYDKVAVDIELSKFATLSARIDGGAFDFPLAEATDSPDQIREKFLKYVETKQYAAVEKALRDIAEKDLPLVPPEQAPVFDKEADPKN